jgi:hypothetical protein
LISQVFHGFCYLVEEGVVSFLLIILQLIHLPAELLIQIKCIVLKESQFRCKSESQLMDHFSSKKCLRLGKLFLYLSCYPSLLLLLHLLKHVPMRHLLLFLLLLILLLIRRIILIHQPI